MTENKVIDRFQKVVIAAKHYSLEVSFNNITSQKFDVYHTTKQYGYIFKSLGEVEAFFEGYHRGQADCD
jgi:hypothetical protein